eukprot:2606635-Rhodomonas_salina.2
MRSLQSGRISYTSVADGTDTEPPWTSILCTTGDAAETRTKGTSVYVGLDRCHYKGVVEGPEDGRSYESCY